MKKLKQIKAAAAVLASIMAAAVMPGCGVQKNLQDSNGSVTLKYIMSGPGRQKDSQEVWAVFNEKLHEYLPNVNVEFDVIAMADYKQTYLLMQTGKEQMDIVNTYGLDFWQEIENGSFLEISDLLDENGKEIKEVLPDWLFDYMKVDGELYGVPSYQMLSNERCLVMQKEYADKYLDTEALKNEMHSSDYFTDKTAEMLDSYLEKLAADGKIYYGANIYNEAPMKGYESMLDNFVIDSNTNKIAYKFETEAMKKQYERHARWFKNGWIRQDALSYTTEGNVRGYKDGYVLYDDIYSPWRADTISKDGTEFITIPFRDYYFIDSKNAAGGTAISASSKHPKEAMQVINLLQTNKELYNLLVYGIEGRHYTKTGEETIETPYGEQGNSSDDYGIYKWIIGNTELAYVTQAQPNAEEYKKWVFQDVNKSEHRSRFIGLTIDTEKIADNISQLTAIKGEYMKTLASGALGDEWEAYYNEWMDKANAAGMQEVKAEIQKQVDEFLNEK